MTLREAAVNAAKCVRANHKRLFCYHANEQQLWDENWSRDATMAKYILSHFDCDEVTAALAAQRKDSHQ